MGKLVVGGEDAEMFATVHQPDKRRIGTPLYFDIGVTVLKETAMKGQYKFVASSGNAVDRQHQLEINPGYLTAGTYLLVPTSTGCKMEGVRRKLEWAGKGIKESDMARSAVLSVHCDKLFSIQEIEFSKDAYDLAIKLPAIHNGTQTDLFGDGSVILYTLKSGYNGNTYVAENKKRDMYVKLEMDFTNSSNIITEDGALAVTAIIAPGESRCVHHLMPLDENLPWSAGTEMCTDACTETCLYPPFSCYVST